MKQLLVFCGVALLLPVAAQAETVVRTGEAVQIAADQVVEQDFYAAGDTILMSGSVVGDMYAAAGDVTINGPISEDLTLFAGVSQVHASVTDDVRIVGGEVTLAEAVGGDVFVIGGSLKVLSTATVAGDVYFFGGEAEIAGNVGGSVVGIAERVRIDSAVASDVSLEAESLVLGDRANVAGTVTYTSSQELVRSQNAVVQGEIIRSSESPRAPLTPADFFIPLLVTLFCTLSFYLLFRHRLQTLIQNTWENSLQRGLLGMAIILLSLPVVILLMVAVLSFWLGLLGLFTALALFITSFILMHIALGALMSRLVYQEYRIDVYWVVLGTVATQLIGFVPVIGPVLLLVLFAITLGGLCVQLYLRLQN